MDVRSRHGVLVLVAVVALLLTACGSSSKGPPASAPTSGGTTASTAGGTTAAAPGSDVGLTATQIHIAMIADVDASFDPGLFQKNVNLVKAWAATLNAHGGLAGRQVVVDFCDSKADPNATANCIIQACSKDFAMVGTASLVVTDASDFATCKNSAGQPIGIPNLVGTAETPNVTCSPDVFFLSPDPTLCATQNDKTITYTVNRGDGVYYAQQFPGLHGIFVISSSTPQIDASESALDEGRIAAGIKADSTTFYSSAESPTSSEMLPYVQTIKRFGSTYVQNDAGQDSQIEVAKEAALQGVTTVKVWGGNVGSYQQTFLQEGGTVVNNSYMQITSLPFYEEYQSNPALSTLVSAIGGVQNMDGNSLSSFVSALLFQDAVQKTVANGGTLNRQTLLNTLNNDETAFNAQGIIGTTNVSKHQLSPCIVMVAVLNGKFQRVFPTKPGTFDCNPANITTVSENAS